MVAVGISIEIALCKYHRALRLDFAGCLVLFISGAGTIGGGLAALFHRKKIGAIIGARIAIGIIAIALLNLPEVLN